MRGTLKNTDLRKKNILVNRGTLSEGLKNIADYLGLNPEKSVFLHSTVVNDDNLGRRLFYKPSFAHSQILSILPRESTTPKGVCLYVNKDLRDYLSEVGLAPKENYFYIDKYPSKNTYPYFSVSGYFKEYLKNFDIDELESISGSTVVSSFISRDDEIIANFIKGSLIMNVKDQVKFNSKYYLRQLSEKYDYPIPRGVAFEGLNSLEDAFTSLKELMILKGYNIDNAKVWCKFQSQTSGKGSYLFEGFNKDALSNTRSHIFEFCQKLYISEDEILNKVPLILEVDVNSIPDEIQIGNIGVEAVVGSDSITLVGCVSQDSKAGRYIGSIINTETKELSKYAEEAALPFLKAIQIEGYRGFMTIDVLLTKSDTTGKISGYNIDPNARFTAGTPLLSLLQYSEKMSEKELFGLSYSNAIKDSDNLFDRVKYYCGDDLYLGKDSNYQGIIPIILNDVNFFENKKRYLRTVVIKESISQCKEVYMNFKEKIIKDLNS
jgi:hypothetical protein